MEDNINNSIAFEIGFSSKDSLRKRHQKARLSGEPYMTQRKVLKTGILPPSNETTCKCNYSCKEISGHMKAKLNADFRSLDLNGQGNYLMGLIDVVPVHRRRHGKYEDPGQSRRQSTYSYTVPDGKGGIVKVCKSTFMSVFGIKSSQKIATTMKKKKLGETVYKDKRGGIKNYKYTINDRIEVKEHINSFPRDESHYGRSGSSKEYLSSDLNLTKLYQAFLIKNPNTHIKFKFYRKVFLNDFKLSFKRPRVDTCETCDVLNMQRKSKFISVATRAKTLLEVHHRKAKNSFNMMKADALASMQPGRNVTNLVMDLQKVFPLPKLTHSDMYYLRQLSCYNFGIHITDTGDAAMCLWHEGQSGRGGNQMASCLLQAINSGTLDTQSKYLIVWSDNCGGQLKNRMLVCLYMMLISWDIFHVIEHKFLLSGHSFSSADRDFAIIEKRAKVCKMQVVEDVKKVILSARTSKPFKVIDMEDSFFDFDTASNEWITTKSLKISKVTCMKLSYEDQGYVHYKTNYDMEVWQKCCVLKKGVKPADISTICLKKLESGCELSQNKKKDISSVIPYLDEENNDFYRKLIQ